MMESRGDDPFKMSGTLHHGGAWPNNKWTTTGDHSIGVDLSADYHVYSIEWTADSIKWYLDNTLFQTISMNQWFTTPGQNTYSKMGQPFDQKFHIILNLAVGGNFFSTPIGANDAAGWSVNNMRVDYVRVYQQGGTCNGNADQNARPTTSTAVPTSSVVSVTSVSGTTCNGQGYNSAAYTCTINDKGAQVLCSTGSSSCGNACYDSSLYCCQNSGLTQKSLCPALTRTTAATTAATTKTTSAATQTSAANNGLCNGGGYDATHYTCTTNEAGAQVLCQNGYSSCGGACYLTSSYCCKNHQLTPKGSC